MLGRVRIAGFLLTGLGLAAGAGEGRAQVKLDLVNEVGATGPCVGLGLGVALVKKCSTWLQRDGFLRVGDVGSDGLTIGTEGKEDGVVTAVAPGGTSGVLVGDRIVSVDGKVVQWTMAMEVARQVFGEAGQEVKLTVKPGGSGAEKEMAMVRDQAPPPAGAPKSDSFFVTLTPLVDWRGRFVSCSSTGPLGAATVALCAKHFKPWGYVKAKNVGSVGFAVKPEVDTGEAHGATVLSVEAGSAAARAGLAVGDTIVAVDGKPLTGGVGALAKEKMFGRDGETRAVTVERAGAEKTETVVLKKVAE